MKQYLKQLKKKTKTHTRKDPCTKVVATLIWYTLRTKYFYTKKKVIFDFQLIWTFFDLKTTVISCLHSVFRKAFLIKV